MDNSNLTMKEYIRLEEEKAHKRGKVFNWQTAAYGRIRVDDDFYDLRSMEAEFPTIVFNDTLTSEAALLCERMVSSLNNDEIDLRISFDESDDEDCTPTVSYFDDLDYFKDFDNEFPAIVYNDAPTETSLSEYNEEEQNVLCFNDLFPFNIIYPHDLKSDTGNDNDTIDIEQPPRDLSVKPLPDTIYTAYPNPMDTAYRLFGRYPIFIFSTVYTAYSLNEYSVFDTSINTAYPGDRVKNIDEYWWRIYKSGDLEVLES
ncbi:hypothetical protein Tco_0703671 [Tanacetum coccineum]|uniref:Uncharacterized protein n=1 Tax=Tanacetum coccineum TaxID=301880 RepID=A0ABQ4XZH5_9ASTR